MPVGSNRLPPASSQEVLKSTAPSAAQGPAQTGQTILSITLSSPARHYITKQKLNLALAAAASRTNAIGKADLSHAPDVTTPFRKRLAHKTVLMFISTLVDRVSILF